ncbi:threonine--tRNA ligase [Rickettsiella endosymbiont of Litargus connexus]|jgi:threonyl-tRNA synthetase|uniref:threonine--tRNA ligase n=1 Tax=Rickettsiella endosymbiont of Litargus connexus TaxID=3066237 RepID=UPI00376F2221|nr:threonine--tRNA ligase [Gammaproteobacteria bacterium]MCH9755296.1 threonine--tRNA ligase [Gammaproteobacteria bacterium]MDD5162509.1 threonine--tRNA ligase [Candidatus Rickettsiella isopodorum]
MPVITLPDTTQRTVASGATAYQVAEQIGPGLAKAAIAAEIDGQLVDLSYSITKDIRFRILTARDPEALAIIRHSTAHLLAHAVKQLFPTAQVTIGPVIENGFYYDFALSHTFTPDDLLKIEKRMQELVKQDLLIQRSTMSREEAIKFFRNLGEEYKAEIITAIPTEEVLSLYREGDFIDLCRGPHVPSTGKLKVFKLTHVAGAYWRGDAKNEMLQRIYGTAWLTENDLKDYLYRLEEAEKRDHRKLAKQLDLFHIQEEAPGMVFWHPHGWTIYQIIEQYIRSRLQSAGYQEIRTPQLLARQLWEKSGHWDKFFKEMFTTVTENTEFAIKPMNCPGHIQIFNQGIKSYRDLPLRFAEFGSCHRNEPSGALHGLMRVRGFVQDDAHIFCTEDQIQAEVAAFIDLLYGVYADFGFDEVILKLATRPEARVGSDESWDKAEKALAQALDARAGLKWTYSPGEGAFYGPKIEFSLKDCLNRVWQCGTVQVDFSMPGRLGAEYVSEQGERKTPVMLHRAILGSIERFIGILIEHYAGHFPVWLAPIQVVIMTITDKQRDYATEIAQELESLGLRVKLDLRNEKISFKIREHSLQKIPYQLVIGAKEVNTKQVAVRRQTGDDLGSMSVHMFYQMIRQAMVPHSRIDTEK